MLVCILFHFVLRFCYIYLSFLNLLYNLDLFSVFEISRGDKPKANSIGVYPVTEDFEVFSANSVAGIAFGHSVGSRAQVILKLSLANFTRCSVPPFVC